MITSNRARDRLADPPWFMNPDRACKDDDVYADVELIETPPDTPVRTWRDREIRRRVAACHSCPVLEACFADFYKHMTPKQQRAFNATGKPPWTHAGIRAGIVGA